MKKKAKGLLLMLATLSPAWANDINLAQCQDSPRSDECLTYLEGLIDGALAMRGLIQPAPLTTDSVSERALKFRSGRRFKQANAAYCEQRLPQRDQLVLALDEWVEQGMITTQSELQQALAQLMHCR
ncbi:hypothetical protein [Ferrimonas pelagia]|uniref:Uncharacterized protein n=1 Tax=Ferrimonas pelagia TaxID=1177826 RepID=A0ABP9FC16_9GAMM